MTHNSEIARAVRRALFMGACVTGGITSALAQDQAAENPDVVDTVVVTGSRIVSPNLQSISPVTSMSAEEVARTGRSTIEDVINELPQVFSAQGANVSNGSNGTATVNLRGLGSNRTLVLINGRRLGPGDPGSSGTSTGFASDINMVPTALVERVELLTGGASSVYGADAVGGVVNFIINKKFEGVRINGGYSFYNHKNDDSKSQARRGRCGLQPAGRHRQPRIRQDLLVHGRFEFRGRSRQRYVLCDLSRYRSGLAERLRLQFVHVQLGRRIQLRRLEHLVPGALPLGRPQRSAASVRNELHVRRECRLRRRALRRPTISVR